MEPTTPAARPAGTGYNLRTIDAHNGERLIEIEESVRHSILLSVEDAEMLVLDLKVAISEYWEERRRG